MTVVPRPQKPRTAWKYALIGVVLAAITAYTWVAVGANVSDIVNNWSNATDKLVQLTQPDYWFFPETLSALTETLQMAVIATAIGAGVSLPLSFLASRAANPNAGVVGVVRTVCNVIRAVPDLLYAAVLVSVVGTGALPGIIALILFDIGIVVKLVSEALDGIDRGGQEAALAAGATWPRADRAAVLPEIFPAFASQTLYVLELNVRASTVLGLVGAGGLGLLIDNVRTYYKYHQLSLIILEILVVVVAIELASGWLRRRLVA
ncbi:phosphonate ABC transporter, permease protein PhnE [Actinomycetes bacterium M1A6_2h]